MIPPTVPPFPFYIINKDIIKGSFPFRKTFHTPKPDFEPRFRPPRVFRRPEEPEQNHGNGTNRRRRTLCLPKPDFATSISTASRVPPTRRAGTEPRKRNKPEAKDALPAEARFRNPDFTTSIPTAPRVPPTRVFRQPEEPEQNHGNGTNRRRRKVFQSGEHANSKIILSLPPKTSKPDSRHHRPVRQKVRF